MTKFQQSINEGYAKIIIPDKIRAKSLLKSAEEAIYSAQKIPLEENTFKSIVRELYEGLRQYCEALGYTRGYKFLSHEAITYFLEDILNEKQLSFRFERYRKVRNGINYYGDYVKQETVKEALEEIPKIITELKKHMKLP